MTTLIPEITGMTLTSHNSRPVTQNTFYQLPPKYIFVLGVFILCRQNTKTFRAHTMSTGMSPELKQILMSCLPKRESQTVRIEACYCRRVTTAYRTA
jgi:hypothetical protein